MQTVKEPKNKEPMASENKCRDYDESCPGMGCALHCWLYAPEQGWCPLLKTDEQ